MIPLPGAQRLSVKLGLVLFAAVGGALAIVYVAVLPRLESRLVDAKVGDLEASLPTVAGELSQADRLLYQDAAEFFSETFNVRVVIYDRLTEHSLRTIADSSGGRGTDAREDEVALRAAASGLPATGRVERDGKELAEAAAPIGPGEVVLLSAPLTDALANVRLVRRTLLLAGSVALLVAWLAGFLAALSISRRVGRLEAAAERIAAGEFDVPLAVRGRDEIAELGEAFETMRKRLASLDRARREFIANASHELRTPIFAVGGFVELLVDEVLDEATRREFLGEMRAQVERLARLATDLLDLSRLDADQLSVEIMEVDLAAVARTVVDEFRALVEASEHELALVVDAPVLASADEQRVVQIARILVENALRHTPRGTPVEVRVGRWEARAVLAVRDSGPGIAAEELERIFDRFYRGETGTAAGSGLGLAIARELAAKMAGTLRARSVPGETVFTLSLPLAGIAAGPFSREKPAGESKVLGPRAPAGT